MNQYDRLSPLAVLDDVNLYRVPITFPTAQDGNIVVFVGDAHIRMFNNKTLPDFLKTSIVEIKLIQGRTPFRDEGLRDGWMTNKTGINSLDKIGWQIDETFYVVIVNRENFMSLRGENDMQRLGPEYSRKGGLLLFSRMTTIRDGIHYLHMIDEAKESLKKQYVAWSQEALAEEVHRRMRLEIYRRIDDENARRESERADKKAFERI
jgi:hypothetical protein